MGFGCKHSLPLIFCCSSLQSLKSLTSSEESPCPDVAVPPAKPFEIKKFRDYFINFILKIQYFKVFKPV